MTAGTGSHRRPPPPPDHQAPSRKWIEHSSAQRTMTDVVMVDAIRKEYPQLHLTVVPQYGCSILAYAAAGHAAVAPIDSEKEHMAWRLYLPPARRLNGGKGFLGDRIIFGKYLIDWKGKEFVMYIVDGRDGNELWGVTDNQYILSSNIEYTNQLLLEAGAWSNELHNEVWVFDGGFWDKSAELWDAVANSSWDDVILDKSMKDALINDVETFFNGRESYENLKVPWKRGIIYYGPPGNGKTISIKAMMHTLYSRKPAIPTLYVRSLASWAGPEYSINQIFGLARRTAPCYLVFEDLDSIVSDQVRSYFLNEVDGIKNNDGILMVGSTNHLDRLDPGISKRPSRFDRKYFFDNPNMEERTLYMKFWQKKLSSNHDLDFPDKLCPAVAKITDGFSFAYLQEAMVASLLAIARDADTFSDRVCLECLQAHDKPASGATCENEGKRVFKGLFDWVWLARQVEEDDPSLDDLVLWREIKKQVRILREEMGDKNGKK